MKRLKYAFKWFWAAFKKPETFRVEYFELLGGICNSLKEAAQNEQPQIYSMGASFNKAARIKYELPEKIVLLHVWVGVNDKDNPIKRLHDVAMERNNLLTELNELKAKLGPHIA